MKLKNIALSFALVGGIVVTGVTPTTAQAAEPTKAQLQKQVSNLKSQINSKNATIRQLKSQINSSYVLKTVNEQLYYKGYLSPKKVTIGNITVPSLLDYKGIYYAPVQETTSILSLPYSKDSKTVYIGSKPKGQFMMDIKALHPYNNSEYELNTNMSLAGVSYNKGIALKSWNGETYSINLGGKYSNIQGLVGIDSNVSTKTAEIKITDENDNVLYDSEIYKAELPKELDIDVTGINNLKIYVQTDWASSRKATVSLVNLTIK